MARPNESRFRWVECQLDILQKCLTRKELKAALQNLPKGLYATYDRILESIKGEHQQMAIRALQWLAFSLQPLEPQQLAEAIAIDPEHPESVSAFDRDEVLVNPQDIYLICPSLVTISTQLDIYGGTRSRVSFAHASVKEYLMSEYLLRSSLASFHLDAAEGHQFIATCCLQYLLQLECSVEQPLDDDFPTRIQNYALVECLLGGYMIWQWLKHVDLLAVSHKRLKDLILRLYTGMSCYAYSGSKYDPQKNKLLRMEIAASDDVTHILSHFFNNPTVTEARATLTKAVTSGREDCVAMILENGVDPNYIPDKVMGEVWDLYSLLIHAVKWSRGNERIVKLLLDHGASINGTDNYSPIAHACLEGHLEIVMLLLSYGADANAGKSRKGSPISSALASNTNSVEMVELLLTHGANANGNLYDSEPPLGIAARSGNIQLVRLLLDHGASAHTDDRLYSDCAPLVRAAEGGTHEFLEIAELLVERGAKPNRPALREAYTAGSDDMVELLLKHHANPNDNLLREAFERKR